MNGITREQRDGIVRLAAAYFSAIGPASMRDPKSAERDFVDYLDFLVAEPAHSRCSDELREQGKPYPRTCMECGLGPCKRKVIAKSAEQTYGSLATVAEVQAEEDARLHADDARAFGAALLTVPREYSITSNIELAKKAHEIADAFKAERKRRQG